MRADHQPTQRCRKNSAEGVVALLAPSRVRGALGGRRPVERHDPASHGIISGQDSVAG